MIQWIALAMAADAESRAARANETANEANRNASIGGSSLVIVRPVDLVKVPERVAKGFWDSLTVGQKKVLGTVPWATLSIKKSDILNLREFQDEDGAKYVRLQISEYANVYRGDSHIIGLYVPGTMESVAAVLDGK